MNIAIKRNHKVLSDPNFIYENMISLKNSERFKYINTNQKNDKMINAGSTELNRIKNKIMN